MEMITLKCDICNAEVTPAKTMLQAKRNLGLHKRGKHNIAGKRSQYPLGGKMGGRPRPSPESLANQDLGRDMTVAEAKLLTPEQKRIRMNLRKAKWWKEHHLEIEARKRERRAAAKVDLGRHIEAAGDKSEYPSNTPEARKTYYQMNRERILEYQRRQRLKRSGVEKAITSTVSVGTDEPVACKLSECPNCGTRFFMQKGQQ